jgi:CHAD domain-containing protein
VGEVVLAYLHDQAEAIVWGDPAVRQDLPDAVHKMRVATRRMRSVLQAYGKVVDRSGTRELTGELKWLAGVLGDARDLEVLHARFTHAVDELPEELVVGPVQARLTRYFAPREADARTALIAALDSDRYLALLAAVDRLLADPPLTRLADGSARRELPAPVGRAHRRVAAHVKVADQLGPGKDRDSEWHEALCVPGTLSHHATCTYSWRRPPSRSRRSTRTGVPVGRRVSPTGGRWCSDRCGRWRL